LVTECHRLRHIPLKNLAVEELGTLIGQEIGVQYLVPVAIEILDDDPWAGGYMYPGHLMKRVVELPASFRKENPQMVCRFQSVLDEVERRWRFYQDEIRPAWLHVFGGV